MRIESFKITPQQQASGNSWMIALLVRLYAFSMRLYPPAFRVDFAGEMLDVFSMTLREAHLISAWAVLVVLWREAVSLPVNIVRVHFQRSQPTTPITLWRTRQVIRWSSLTLSLFILRHLIVSLNSPQTLAIDGVRLSMFFVLLFSTSVSMLLAWRWERLGGLLTMVCGTALGAFLTFYIAYFRPAEISLIGLVLIGILWALPFVTFGMMFYHLSQRPVSYKCLA